MERTDSEVPQPEPQGLTNVSRSVYFSSSRRRGKDHPPLVFVSLNNCLADALQSSPLKNRRPKQTPKPTIHLIKRSKTPEITKSISNTQEHNTNSYKSLEKKTYRIMARSSIPNPEASVLARKVSRSIFRDARSVSPTFDESPNPVSNPVGYLVKHIQRVQQLKRRVL
jgi:hypothetical protein